MQPNQPEATEPTPDTESPAEDTGEGSEGSTFIELEIKADGSMMVSLESDHDEEAETSDQEAAEPAGTPAKNIDDACRIIKEIAKQVMGATPEAQAQEQAGYAQAMAE
jgi:hypothetical protein